VFIWVLWCAGNLGHVSKGKNPSPSAGDKGGASEASVQVVQRVKISREVERFYSCQRQKKKEKERKNQLHSRNSHHIVAGFQVVHIRTTMGTP